MIRQSNGAVKPCLANVHLILTRSEEWRGVVARNEFTGTVVKAQRPPFSAAAESGDWNDEDDARTALWFSQKGNGGASGLDVHDRLIQQAVLNAADAQRFHPVRDYLRGLKWDGVPRAGYWLQAYLGAEPTVTTEIGGKSWRDVKAEETYPGKVGMKFLIGAVARVMRPGCKVDNVMILEGIQGVGKSSVFAVLAQPWFTDQQIKIGEKDTYEVMRGQWIVELPELDALSKAEASSAKAFFSRSVDRFRMAYGRRAASVPRQCVFGGTVNHYQYLQDPSGNRRYLPVRCARADLEDLAKDRDQLWAEAMALFESGARWWADSAAERAMFEQEQDARYVGDAWEPRILRYVQGLNSEPSQAPREAVTTGELLQHALGLDPSKWTRAEQIRLGFIMERLRWLRKREQVGGLRQWAYFRPAGWEPGS